ncbi:hypothetical protein N7499_003191 [Penicillium canescens]|uniref:Uncharacterized protein n=2 Tax=Penicillium canescens TaxID=5083 RepID=A0AAD6N7R2_PENCN|nr:hypothetical protein N7460_007316 [Penicillium canescens]KAJ6059996.1 hypothetical protein N7444_002928 [Penicillium canescens]KAJ6093860.1 hypothetical protein N7499_003191 [Penicillium canescens]KAJ6174354.1 hypothetical protein N7485_005420 [Penicillium canescens]
MASTTMTSCVEKIRSSILHETIQYNIADNISENSSDRSRDSSVEPVDEKPMEANERLQPWHKVPEVSGPKDKVYVTAVRENIRLFGNHVNAHS